ncbi:hypothetical protein GCM10022247_53750 [Allokutzneria multivorans]|uniref:Uncharacterized protein n=1 Tax=Allokutzneria multivorans TaxID=1142134 RepID=A0ABP7T8V9_9PSEU
MGRGVRGADERSVAGGQLGQALVAGDGAVRGVVGVGKDVEGVVAHVVLESEHYEPNSEIWFCDYDGRFRRSRSRSATCEASSIAAS